ncbi:VOC family protein [Pseudomonas japonica]|uniref:Glyoxalase/Bleomycin resistance protein/Dioxygenase superfamily protein n=1 Tax=Pseudomonas japonica TaxID=256466 RepID=A0A239LDS0_9PSED|nr:VOC family protein [Pseudomonas japonica]SNT27684.1 Glyoxalase/Bleomycin resistance protein/Dioxygenase superfamily protein [Pseudomonas japonica]
MNPFRELHHLCIVVHELERAVAWYEALGIGPWQAFPSLEAFAGDLQVPCTEDFLKLRYRFCNLDNLQLQLCAPPPGNTPQRQHLEAHGEGVFHLGFKVAHCDAGEQAGRALGLDLLLRGRLPNGHGFSYFDTREAGAGVVLQVRSAAG